jgi:CheY-like chemotaxis protein
LKHLNGSIEVESEEGKGTAFKVKIPVTPGERLPTTTSIGSRTGEAVVLVVDDRIDILEGIREVLGELDCRCECTDSPAVAANMLAVNKYDIVLIDLEMPMKSGSELASEIKRSLGPNRDTPLIAFSAAADARAGKTWPFVDFLSKPVSKTQLKIALDRHMSTKPT